MNIGRPVTATFGISSRGEFTSQCISEHTRTQAAMIEKFIDCEIEFVELNPDHFHVKVKVQEAHN